MTMSATDLTLRKSIRVEAPLERAFHVFTEGMGTWWPLETHSIKGKLAQEAVLEPGAGGEIYERSADGRASWGEVLAWEPPHRVVFSWGPGYDDAARTEVEVRFRAEDDGTRVDLEHRGWERLGEDAERRHEGYDTGWDHVLGRYADAASA